MDGQVNIIAVISLSVTVVGMIISILTFNHAVKERHGKTAAETAGIGLKVDALQKSLDKFEKKIDKIEEGFQATKTDIAKLETRIDGLEKRVTHLEEG